MKNVRIFAVILIIIGAYIGWSVYSSEVSTEGNKFKLGLDLNGGARLIYKADVSKIAKSDVGTSMQTLRDVIERRVNALKVSEPVVQIEEGGTLAEKGSEHKLVVELPGVTDIDEAKKAIGETPFLSFKLLDEKIATELNALQASSTEVEAMSTSSKVEFYLKAQTLASKLYVETGLDGTFLQRAVVQFNGSTGAPTIGLTFNDEGKAKFAKITKENIGKTLAIFLDNEIVTDPVIQTSILDGKAEITGKFTLDEAKTIVRNLNYGALPVPVELLSTQTVGASLGSEATKAGTMAGLYAFIIIAIFLVLWYRLPGVLAVIALMMYVIINLAIFKYLPVTLTAAGMAAFVLSMGMAVDANILIFERMKEELKSGKSTQDAIREGFARAWLSIRDSNISSIITAIILYVFPSSSIIQGFALVFFIGVVVSMFSAITFSRTLLLAIGLTKNNKFIHFILSSGFSK